MPMTTTSRRQANRVKVQSAKVHPNILPPTSAQWAALDASAVELLNQVLSEPVAYIKDPLFRQANAEEVLFCGNGDECCARLKDIGQPRSIVQERILFQRLNYSRMRQARLLRAYDGKRMPLRNLRELVLWSRRARSVRDFIVECNAPLVLAMIRRMRPSHVEFDELLSEGNFALLRAVDKFDCSRGFRFSTYACRAILKSFARAAQKSNRYHTRFPVQYEPELERSDDLERRHDDVIEGCVQTIQEILTDNRAELTRQEQLVVAARFQLSNGQAPPKAQTLEQVGNMIGVTKERVRQIQNRALSKLRLALEEGYLDPGPLPRQA